MSGHDDRMPGPGLHQGRGMRLSARVDFDVVAVETADEVAVLVDVGSAEPDPAEDPHGRPAATLEVVLDRSGSMGGPALAGALQALRRLVARLDRRDNFGVVAFDDSATVVVPAGRLRDKATVVRLLGHVVSGGLTDLGGGYLRGLQELRRVAAGAGGTLLLISDGYANQGITDPAELGRIARQAAEGRVITSTLGYGLGYDETALVAMARDGSGNHHFAKDPDAAGAAIGSEVSELLAKSVQAVSVLLRLEPGVSVAQLYNDLPTSRLADGGLMVELGDFYAGEQRRLVLRLAVPAMAGLGLATVATVELRYVDLPDVVERTVTVPIRVNVVPRDAAAARTPDAQVRTELLFQEAQVAKREASEALELGERHLADELFGAAERSLLAALELAPIDMADDVAGEQRQVAGLRERSGWDDTNVLSKASRASYHRQNRRRSAAGRPSGAEADSDERPPPAAG